MNADLDAVRMQRNMWMKHALHDRYIAKQMMEAAKEHHAHCDAMEITAMEAVYTAREVARVFTAVMDGTTAIGGAL